MLRRSHDHHRGVRARRNATTSPDSSNDRHQDRHLMTASQSRKSVRRARWLSIRHGRARSDIRQPWQLGRQVHGVRRHPPLIRLPFHRRTTRCIGSIQISQRARGAQIPITPARTALRSLKRGFLPWRLSDAGRRIRGAVSQAAGIRNPSQQRSPIQNIHRISGSYACWGRWSDIQGGVLNHLAARTAEIPAEEHALRPVAFGAEWR